MSNYFKSRGAKASDIADGMNDTCGCVADEPSLAFLLTEELDSFGKIGGFIECRTCAACRQEEELRETHTCADCKSPFTVGEGGYLWRWYDFYPAQGDEALPICALCRNLPRHVARKEQDRKERDWEDSLYSEEW